MKLAVVLLNLGGPDSLDAVEPFLRNLFGDPAILSLPAIVRVPLAHLIASRRAPFAREIYKKIGGRSPILDETKAQAKALDDLLAARGIEARSFIAMRCWHPFSDETVAAVKAWRAESLALLPLYPQYSTTTTASSFGDWDRAARAAGLELPTAKLCCYPADSGFVAAMSDLIHQTLTKRRFDVDYRLLLSAHGLPKRVISRGDPYQWQVEQTAGAIVHSLGMNGIDWKVCYQSRVGPLAWIGPATSDEIRRAGAERKGVVVAPIAFVSDHSETLVELDMEYAQLAQLSGVPDYLRVPTVSTHPKFIEGLADLLARARNCQSIVSGSGARICPRQFRACACGG